MMKSEVIVQFAPTMGKAIVYDEGDVWVIDVSKLVVCKREYDPQMHNVRLDSKFFETRIADAHPYVFIEKLITRLYEEQQVLYFMMYALDARVSKKHRIESAQILVHYAHTKGIVSFARKNFKIDKTLHDIDVDSRVLHKIPLVFKKIILAHCT